MYAIPSVLIALALFVSLLLAIEAGYRLGERHRRDDATKAHVNTISGALLGVLALLLGFTFSLALQRHDARSAAVVDEANAIGTAQLRAQLLPAPFAAQAQATLADYVALRIAAGAVGLQREAERAARGREALALQQRLWAQAVAAAPADASPVRSGLYLQALNDLIDAQGAREAALARHVPELVLWLLYGTFVLAGSSVGFAAGLGGHRAAFVSYVLVGLIVLLVFVIVDLDRPRRGLIAVDQSPLQALQPSVPAAAGGAAGAP